MKPKKQSSSENSSTATSSTADADDTNLASQTNAGQAEEQEKNDSSKAGRNKRDRQTKDTAKQTDPAKTQEENDGQANHEAGATEPEANEQDGERATRRVRYALIGLGHIAQNAVIPGFGQARNSELAALVSGDKKKLRTLKKKHDVKATYTYEQFDECLNNPEIDAVYIALPNDLHVDAVLRAVAAGKHVLCEKPLAATVQDAQMMARAAEGNGVKLMTAYRLHFEPATLATVELVRSGKLGEPRYFSSTFSYEVTDPNNIRLELKRGGGPVYDIGTYCINAARYLMQDEPIEVSAMLARTDDKRFDQVEETAAVLLRFPRGRLASFIVSFGAASASRLELVCTKGRVVLDPAYEYSEALHQTVTIDEESEEKSFPHTDQFGGEIEEFSNCILEDREPEPSAYEGIADLRVIEAIFASAEQQRPIKLKSFRKPDRPTNEQVKKKPAVREPETVNVDSPHD